jgi:hypothetical protein
MKIRKKKLNGNIIDVKIFNSNHAMIYLDFNNNKKDRNKIL